MSPLPIAPVIRTRGQLDLLLENIASLQRERDELFAAQEAEIAAVRQRYRAPLAETEDLRRHETSWAEAWALANPRAFAANRTLSSAHATLGFRAEPPRIQRASRRWTWTRIATTLASLPWGRRYLRSPAPEIDKDAIARDLAQLSPTDLRAAGIRVEHGERFFLVAHRIPPTAWKEAA